MYLRLTSVPTNIDPDYIVVQKVIKRLRKSMRSRNLFTPYQRTLIPANGVLVAKFHRQVSTRPIKSGTVVFSGWIHSHACNPLEYPGSWLPDNSAGFEALAIGVKGWGERRDVISDAIYVPHCVDKGMKNFDLTALMNDLEYNSPVWIHKKDILPHLPIEAKKRINQDIYLVA